MNDDRQLDRLLADWATSDAIGAGDDAAVARMALHGQTIAAAGRNPSAPRKGWWRMVGGGAVAASLLAALVSVTMLRPQQSRNAAQEAQVATIAAATTDAGDEAALESFALLHVPTDEVEEAMI